MHVQVVIRTCIFAGMQNKAGLTFSTGNIGNSIRMVNMMIIVFAISQLIFCSIATYMNMYTSFSLVIIS